MLKQTLSGLTVLIPLRFSQFCEITDNYLATISFALGLFEVDVRLITGIAKVGLVSVV